MNANKKESDSRLFAFIRGLLKNFTHNLHYVFRGYSQVVRYYPEPECARLIAIGGYRPYRDSALTRHADVRRRFVAALADIDVIRCQSVRDRSEARILLEFNP